MSRAFPLCLPESIRRAAENLAREDGVSLNQFVATAVAEKVSALNTATYFRSRAARADRAKFDRVLARLGRLPPRQGDEIDGDGDGAARSKRLRIEIHSANRRLAGELLGGAPEESDRTIVLGRGVELEYQSTVQRHAAELADIVEFVLTVSGSVSAPSVAQLVVDWLYGKFKRGDLEKIVIEREEMELDDQERIRRIVREKISRERERREGD